MSEIDLSRYKLLKEQQIILRELAIKRADRGRLHRALLRNGAIFIAAAVSIFAMIWWFGL